ncbi:MAG: hypothetical protein E6G41_00455 [Actinobacteria bacterium]|nr:MAG: hypothetical protein E6G41_00455 [Actinomycetota bacterium]
MHRLALVLACVLAAPAAAGELHADNVLVVGDSLATGLEPYLGQLVAPRSIVWDASAGRTTPEGLVRLRAQLRVRDRIRRALRAIPPHVCIVWADLDRPARKGPYRPLNAALARAARHDHRLVLVHWHHAVASHRVRLPDHIHPDTAGFEYRSRLFAQALERCFGGA